MRPTGLYHLSLRTGAPFLVGVFHSVLIKVNHDVRACLWEIQEQRVGGPGQQALALVKLVHFLQNQERDEERLRVKEVKRQPILSEGAEVAEDLAEGVPCTMVRRVEVRIVERDRTWEEGQKGVDEVGDLT